MARNLIGTGADQVSVNGMLGELAFQSKENVNFTGGTGKLSRLDIDAISAQLGVTATDVFVYDTRKDSDGGAWRKRCTHTSWYNEELNTATRGSRREFPTVAIIVATSSTVIIYDGDRPDLPMWMVFAHDGVISWSTSGAAVPTAVFALNGVFALGIASGGIQLYNFVADDIRLAYATYAYALTSGRLITNRNNVTSYTTTGDGYIITTYNINDVAMTILPNAPIDVTTGLPIPTIAAATSSGVNIIHNNGSVSTWTSPAAHSKISFFGNYMYVVYGGNGRVYVDTIPWTNITYASISAGSLRHYRNSDNSGEGWMTDGNALFYRGPTTPAIAVSPTNYGAAIASSQGLSLIAENAQSPSNGMVAYATSKFATGWMHGNIKGAWLSDTTQGTLTGSSNFISNGTFVSTTTGWSGGGLTWDAGARAKVTGSVLYGGITQTVSGLTVGKQYIIKAKVDCTAANMDVRVQFSGIGALHASASTGIASGVTNIWDTVTATSDTHTLQIIPYGTNYASTFYVDDVEIYEAESDKSANRLGLQIFGQIAKTPVAVNSDLVAYSGFSANNYLYQPYSNTLDFGTGDFSVIVWIRPTSSAGGYIYERSSISDTGGNRHEFFADASGKIFWAVGSGQIVGTNTGDVSYTGIGVWDQYALVKRSGTYYHYKNGVLITSENINITTHTDTAARLVIGARAYYSTVSSPFAGDIALFRMSATAPADDQIKKMYNDEKMLFQDNAKATLYGTSDSVTAVAYDEDTQYVHVGTSSGRSVFQGLRRIDNTTTAVSAAISASNGLVAEQ